MSNPKALITCQFRCDRTVSDSVDAWKQYGLIFIHHPFTYAMRSMVEFPKFLQQFLMNFRGLYKVSNVKSRDLTMRMQKPQHTILKYRYQHRRSFQGPPSRTIFWMVIRKRSFLSCLEMRYSCLAWCRQIHWHIGPNQHNEISLSFQGNSRRQNIWSLNQSEHYPRMSRKVILI